GIFHNHNEPGSRGGFSVYVPEYCTPDRAMPLVMALHGGSGNGRGFLWSWLRDARSLGAILVAPTAIGPTWALMGDDADTPNLMRILETVRSRWTIAPGRRYRPSPEVRHADFFWNDFGRAAACLRRVRL